MTTEYTARAINELPPLARQATAGQDTGPAADACWLNIRSLVTLALALLAVILFSLDDWQLPTGYLGYDMMLAIGGYLTHCYFHQHRPCSWVEVSRFAVQAWQYLLNRYLMLFLVIAPFALWMLLPQELTRLFRDMAASSLLVSNLTTWLDRSYLSGLVETTPMAHTWLISLLAQFLLLTLVIQRLAPAKVLAIMIVGALLSLSVSMWAVTAKPAAAFYFPATRFWPFALGAITAIVAPRITISRTLNALSSFAGAALVIFAFTQPEFPADLGTGYQALAILGTCLLLLPGKQAQRNLKVMLSGLFTLYLMHHPLVALLKTIGIGTDAIILSAVGALIFAIVTVHGWFRRRLSRATSEVISPVTWIAGLLTISSCVWGVAEKGKIVRHYPDPIFALETIADSRCYGRSGGSPGIGEACKLGGREQRLAVIGDGHAATLFNPLHRRLQGTAIGFRAVAGPYCAPLFDFANVRYSDPGCASATSKALNAIIDDSNINVVVLYAQWANYTQGSRDGNPPSTVSYQGTIARSPEENPELFAEALERTLYSLISAGKRVVLVTSTPEFRLRVLDERSRNWLLGTHFTTPRAATSAYYLRNSDVLKLFEQHARHPDISILDAQTLFCDEGLCEAMDRDDRVLFSDNSHLSGPGAEVLSDAILRHVAHSILLEGVQGL